MPDEDVETQARVNPYPRGGKSSLEKFATGVVLVVVLGIVAFLMFDHFWESEFANSREIQIRDRRISR